MATAIEANFDQKLDEAKLKGVTGGEPITCRGLYQSTFEYVPQFKLWFAVNDLPAARSTADAFWRRARVITFDVPIEAEDRDLELDTKLKAEFPGILAWAVRGCLAWQHNGLTPPAAVRDATKQWQVKVDHLTRFVREGADPRCVVAGPIELCLHPLHRLVRTPGREAKKDIGVQGGSRGGKLRALSGVTGARIGVACGFAPNKPPPPPGAAAAGLAPAPALPAIGGVAAVAALSTVYVVVVRWVINRMCCYCCYQRKAQQSEVTMK